MEKILEQSLLYDFYGELLNDYQKKTYEDFVLNDLSLGEIAQLQGISRQGVHDLIKRCNKLLFGYEQKLHLVEKFMNIARMVEEINDLTREFENNPDLHLIKRIQCISKKILEEL